MNISDLARKLKLPIDVTRHVIPRAGFDIGLKAHKVEDKIAHDIIERVRKSPHIVDEVRAELLGVPIAKQAKISQTHGELRIPETVAVRELSQLLQIPVTDVIKELMKNGIFANLNEEIDFTTAAIIANDLGFKAVKPDAKAEEMVKQSNVSQLLEGDAHQSSRPPVVVIMGHVDHGKTMLLDAIRESDIIATEAGGITQHIGAYQVVHQKRKITFIDTPGHEAFTAMRSRGAIVADVAILVVAWDEGFKPQTIEALNIIKKMEIPFLVAVTKIDKDGFSEDKILQQLAEQNLMPEKWGGKIPVVAVSAKTKLHLDLLLETLLLIVDVHPKKITADPNRSAVGTIIESHTDQGEGPVATVIVQAGTLHTGDLITAGPTAGRVKALKDDRGNVVKEAPPGMPVKILGLKDLPTIGDVLQVTEDKKGLKKMLKLHSVRTQQLQMRQSRISQQVAQKDTADDRLFRMILKSDNLGTLEAINESIEKLPSDEVKVQIVRKGIGQVTEADVAESSQTGAALYAFHIDIAPVIKKIAENDHVEIRRYNVIYALIEDVVKEVESRLPQEVIRTTYGSMKVSALFWEKGKHQVVGGMVAKGKMKAKTSVEIIRNGEKKGTGMIDELRVGARKVDEIVQGTECGINIEKAPHIDAGDLLESFSEVRKSRKLITHA